MKKIGFYMAPLLTNSAGCGEYFIKVAKNFAERVDEVVLVTLDKKFFKGMTKLVELYHRFTFNFKVEQVIYETDEDVIESLGKAKWIQSPLSGLKEALNTYDVVYAKNEVFDLLFLKLIGYKNLPPIIVGVHTPLYYPHIVTFRDRIHNFMYTTWFYDWITKGATLIHLSNKFTYEMVQKKFHTPAEFVYYPYEMEDFRDKVKKYPTDLEFDPKKFNIAFIGRMTEQKGVTDLVEVIKKVAEDASLREKVVFNIFGGGALKYKVDRVSEKYEFAKYHGYVEHNTIPSILSKTQLFLSPAKWETLPFNILEAQTMGVPVVCYDIPGPNDIVVHEKTGLISQNPDELYANVKNCVLGKYSFNEEEIYANIKSKFDPDMIFDKLFKMFSTASEKGA